MDSLFSWQVFAPFVWHLCKWAVRIIENRPFPATCGSPGCLLGDPVGSLLSAGPHSACDARRRSQCNALRRNAQHMTCAELRCAASRSFTWPRAVPPRYWQLCVALRCVASVCIGAATFPCPSPPPSRSSSFSKHICAVVRTSKLVHAHPGGAVICSAFATFMSSWGGQLVSAHFVFGLQWSLRARARPRVFWRKALPRQHASAWLF